MSNFKYFLLIKDLKNYMILHKYNHFRILLLFYYFFFHPFALHMQETMSKIFYKRFRMRMSGRSL